MDWKLIAQVVSAVVLYIGGVFVVGRLMMGVFKDRVNDLRNEVRRDYDRLEAKSEKLESHIEDLTEQLSEVKAELEKANKFIDRHRAVTGG